MENGSSNACARIAQAIVALNEGISLVKLNPEIDKGIARIKAHVSQDTKVGCLPACHRPSSPRFKNVVFERDVFQRGTTRVQAINPKSIMNRCRRAIWIKNKMALTHSDVIVFHCRGKRDCRRSTANNRRPAAALYGHVRRAILERAVMPVVARRYNQAANTAAQGCIEANRVDARVGSVAVYTALTDSPRSLVDRLKSSCTRAAPRLARNQIVVVATWSVKHQAAVARIRCTCVVSEDSAAAVAYRVIAAKNHGFSVLHLGHVLQVKHGVAIAGLRVGKLKEIEVVCVQLGKRGQQLFAVAMCRCSKV